MYGIAVDPDKKFEVKSCDQQYQNFFQAEEIKSEIQKEYIFLLDRSGSMGSVTMYLARSALLLFIQSLEPGCLFNICSFGSNYEFMFPSNSVPYTQENVSTAKNLV